MFFRPRIPAVFIPPTVPPAPLSRAAGMPSAANEDGLRPYLRYFIVKNQDPSTTVNRMSDEQLDGLPYGAVLLSSDAEILRYNRTEAEITGRSQRAVIGRNFFLELAVCGVGPQFQGRYKKALLANEYDEIFPYVFHHQMPETMMLVRMTSGPMVSGKRCVWVFVRRMMPKP